MNENGTSRWGATDKILASILDVGEMMLVSGAEVSRVEDTIHRMASAYGCERVDVFTITSSIVVTVLAPGGEIVTQTRRISGYVTDMLRIDRCNALSRQVCREPLPLEQLRQAVEEIGAKRRYRTCVQCLAYLLVASTFAVFFGGNWQDALAAGICALPLYFLLRFFRRLHFQRLVVSLLSAAATGLMAAVLTKVGIGANMDMICMGNVMLLIPGISFTVSLRDMISGDTISGLLGLCEAVLQSIAIAAGFAVVMWLVGG